MRTVAVVVAIAFLAGCGSATEPGADGEPIDDPVTPVSGPDSLVTTTTTTAVPTTTATTTTVPGQAVAVPEDGFPPDDEPQPRLSIEDALLPDDAFGAPWELQWRQLDAIGYGAGPNQTDCDDYWAYEQLLAGDGGHAMWWADGGNANHRVIRIENQSEALARLVAIGAIAENCPVVNWNEGGSFTVELFTPDAEGVVLRFHDRASGEVTWVAMTLVGDLISVLQMPLWTRADGTMIEVTLDEITSVVREMARRLHDAGPAPEPPVVSTTTTTTTTTTTIVTPGIPPVVVPPTTLDEIGALLLTADEAPAWLRLDDIDTSTPGAGDAEFVAACPAASSLDEIDQALQWQADFTTLEGRQALQLVGEMDDAGAASDAVTRFARVADCDLTTLMPGATGSGGPVEIDGADVAATLFIESPDLVDSRLELGAVAIGSIVAVFTVEAQYDVATAGEQMLEFMSLGAEKIVSR